MFSLVKSGSNVIIRNIAISKVLAANGDAIGVRESPGRSQCFYMMLTKI